MEKSRSFIAVPPGATIKEQIIHRKMSQKELASRMGLSEKHISKLINGEVQLTVDVARRLEMVLGIPSRFWCNLESIYRDKLLQVKEENAMDDDIELARKMPYNEMSKNGWVEVTKSPAERVINLRKYFEVAQLTLLNNDLIPNIACRKLSESEKSDIALTVWAQKAKIESRKTETQPINTKKLESKLPQIREMTTMQPKTFCPKLMEMLASCGVAIVFLPHIGGSFLHGATFYYSDKIVLGLTVRGKDADRFWFSLFHELGHIILGHIDRKDNLTVEDENEADDFAGNNLIPPDSFNEFVENIEMSKSNIVGFAKEINIDTGIVVGRLQKEGKLGYNKYRDLKKQYCIKN